ncbi:NEDD4-binding protein 2-like 2 isoform X2 [Nannospalax galili]|uniref:NEDD4-binding protein 2-like 2 isoform X2 n=1 Tax=Nannospalax galili TaxID=1026970 RepID=UPI00111C28CC|nr:NEDD4-binding protein 2-like 2 isoform X2 [Nannospalax galili]
MPYTEIEAKFLGPGEELTSEPSYKKLKSTADGYVFPHNGGPVIHRIQEKTGNNRVPVAPIDVGGHSCPQEDKIRTTDSLKPLHSEMPGKKLDVTESIGSQALRYRNTSSLSKDDEIYSTSKAFIGPIYKPPAKKKCSERRNKTETLNRINGKGRQEENQKFKDQKLEIDTELSQFYKEIEELENEKDASQSSSKEPEPSQEQMIPYDQGHNSILKADGENKDLSIALQSHCGYSQYLENEPGKYPCQEQMPTFCDTSFTSFRPEWQSVHPFIIPHGPPLPSFNYHFNIQRFSAPPNPPPNIFHAQDDAQMRSGCYVNSCQDNWNCLTFDQNDEYTNYSVTSSVHPFGNGYSVQDDYGFCEIREGCWKDPVDTHNETDRFENHWFQEEKLNKLQKLLILLRGLPGSGKTTLSRVLLGQSRDGIVFSTDDYFHHQDGYRYNVNQLGDAHDWNQNRAKQAIDQGRSPVIIDNTNTQAWEMKPYVEMAIGKGYRVEFHEPETWWKFDPEELEKRNKHGVSRKKIAQMLDRYEFQMSISIVMNSVEPSQKSPQRPLPLQETQRERILKETGYRLGKIKQKSRNRKRNKKNNSLSENLLATSSSCIPGDQAPSLNAEEDCEETKRESRDPFTRYLQNEVGNFVYGSKEKSRKNIDPSDSFQNAMPTVVLDNTPKNCSPNEDDLLLTLSSIPDEGSVICHMRTQYLSCETRDDCSGMKVDKHMGNGHNLAIGTQNIFAKAPCSSVQKIETIDESCPGDLVLYHQRESRTLEKTLREEQEIHGIRNNHWGFFTTKLSDEESQLGFENQPYFSNWPEGPHKFVCEQRQKKDRSHRLNCPDSKEHLIKLISTSEGAAGSGRHPEILMEEKLIEKDLPPATEAVDLLRNPETRVFRSCLPQLNIPEHPLESSQEKQRMQKRIHNLPPDFNLLGQTHINTKDRELCDLLTENHRLNTIWEEKDTLSEIINEEEKKEKIMTFDHHPSWFYLDATKGSPRSIGGHFDSRCLLFNRRGRAVYFYKNPLPSLMPHYMSSFCMVSINNKKAFLTFKSQKRIDKKFIDVGFISEEMLGSQSDTLYSLKSSSDTQILSERFDEELKIREELGLPQCLSIEEHQDSISHDFNSLGLPLSQEFAFHLVKLFGSPGSPMESLLTDDCVIPFDWKTLKMIFLQWKMSIEEREKNISKSENFLNSRTSFSDGSLQRPELRGMGPRTDSCSMTSPGP